MLGKLTFPSL